MKRIILERISKASLNKILDIDNFKDIDWIWVNREIFRDILYNLDLDREFEEEELEKFLKDIEDEVMIKELLGPFKKEGYLSLDQNLFANLEKGYKPTLDIDTIIFVKEKYYRKLFIKQINGYNWVLKAMAIDTYLRMGLEYNSLKETYEELYNENTRIIEDLLSTNEYAFLNGVWKFEKKTKELYFYKSGEFYNSWTEGEVNSRFEELIKK
ncbi:hypothetical protein FQB35_10975 [Crassaminicella thermophila]|uniref:Uncharacterized protein n=1 Tax=Crassaminicella thermophila TaxID=2599308 RepID=A0A5C0SE02_CRATE|nr:hypothetical protein [Crassaminicella thermophila]QEK12805.1 hypothetical protein FQB35_10975 [Crassaminicella thermophila]